MPKGLFEDPVLGYPWWCNWIAIIVFGYSGFNSCADEEIFASGVVTLTALFFVSLLIR